MVDINGLLGKTPTISGGYHSYEDLDEITDGNITTEGIVLVTPEVGTGTLTFDMGISAKVSHTRFCMSVFDQFNKANIQFLYSNNGTDWTSIWSYTNMGSQDIDRTDSLNQIVRYFKLVYNYNDGVIFVVFNIFEVQAYLYSGITLVTTDTTDQQTEESLEVGYSPIFKQRHRGKTIDMVFNGALSREKWETEK